MVCAETAVQSRSQRVPENREREGVGRQRIKRDTSDKLAFCWEVYFGTSPYKHVLGSRSGSDENCEGLSVYCFLFLPLYRQLARRMTHTEPLPLTLDYKDTTLLMKTPSYAYAFTVYTVTNT